MQLEVKNITYDGVLGMYFNSILVQLEAGVSFVAVPPCPNFNSILVQLEEVFPDTLSQDQSYFNSILVQLEGCAL